MTLRFFLSSSRSNLDSDWFHLVSINSILTLYGILAWDYPFIIEEKRLSQSHNRVSQGVFLSKVFATYF